jgi:hypothetical protein
VKGCDSTDVLKKEKRLDMPLNRLNGEEVSDVKSSNFSKLFLESCWFRSSIIRLILGKIIRSTLKFNSGDKATLLDGACTEIAE